MSAEEADYEYAEVKTLRIDQTDLHEESSEKSNKESMSTVVNIRVNGQNMEMHVDSGAEANVMNEETFQQLSPKSRLKDTSVKRKPYQSKPIAKKGYFMARLSTRKSSKENVRVCVTEGSRGRNLVGKYRAFELNILQIKWEKLSFLCRK